MNKILLTGQKTFGNRGCEAIVRGTVRMIQEELGPTDVLVPSVDIEADANQWPDHEAQGVRFIPSVTPWFARYWTRVQGLPVRTLKRTIWPFPIPEIVRRGFRGVDAVLAVGGDNYSLDYRIPSYLVGVDAAAVAEGVPVVLWGASVGPFDKEPSLVPPMKRHLQTMAFIGARESASEQYLRDVLELDNVVPVADPAFLMEPELVDGNAFWPHAAPNGTLGFNVSPLIQQFRSDGKRVDDLLAEISAFFRYAVGAGMSVLLVPHVGPLRGTSKNDDAAFMSRLIRHTGPMNGAVRMMNPRLNAPKIKHVIGQCRFFIGARTHSTIAALSQGVPTVSIAYSVKAMGINRDIFGDTRFVLPTNTVDKSALIGALDLLVAEEDIVRAKLAGTRHGIVKKARASILALKKVLP